MTLKLNGSSSGYTAINAPASAGSNTLVLPTTNGSAGQVLTTDGSGNLTWTTPAGGKILQVASGTTSTEVSVTTTSFADTGLSATITPSSGTKILIMTSQCWALERDTDRASFFWQLMRDSTEIDTNNGAAETLSRSSGGGANETKHSGRMAYTYLDTHGANGSTAVTYKTMAALQSTGNDQKCKFQQGGNVAAHMYLMEVAA